MSNPTLACLWTRVHAAWAMRHAAVRRHVRADQGDDPPPQGGLFNGQKALLLWADHGGSSLYVAPTAVAFVLALVCALGAAVSAWATEPGPWGHMITAALTVVAAICLWQTLFHRHGPQIIDRERYARAKAALQQSADIHARPLGVAAGTAVAFMFVVDGMLTGWSLTSELFGSVLTPRLALMATCVVSAGLAFLLYKLTEQAALEAGRNHRRELVRNLFASPRAVDQERAQGIVDAIGAQLAYDFSEKAHRSRARWTLVLVVLALTTATFTVRLHAERELGAEAPAAAETPLRYPHR